MCLRYSYHRLRPILQVLCHSIPLVPSHTPSACLCRHCTGICRPDGRQCICNKQLKISMSLSMYNQCHLGKCFHRQQQATQNQHVLFTLCRHMSSGVFNKISKNHPKVNMSLLSTYRYISQLKNMIHPSQIMQNQHI